MALSGTTSGSIFALNMTHMHLKVWHYIRKAFFLSGKNCMGVRKLNKMPYKQTIKIISIGFILFLSQGCKAVFHGIKTPSETKPNIILISVDTLRPDHLGCYGYQRNTTPYLDRFANESLLFERCFSHASNTGPSCTSLLSGFLPHETKVITNHSIVHSNVPMLAEILKNVGYTTYGVVSNYVLRKDQGFEQGFDFYDAQMDERELNRKNVCERIAEKTSNSAMDILRGHSGENFFLWIHYQDPHGPYTPKAPYDTTFLDPGKEPIHLAFNNSFSGKGGISSYQRLQDHTNYHYYVSQYDGEISYFDEHFGRLIDFLKEIRVYDTSLIIFTADHGEAMGEHHFYFAHGHGLTNDLIHVPLIIRYTHLMKGRRKDLVQHLDIVPTILKLIHIKEPFPYRGRNLFADQPEPALILSELGLENFSLISGDLKLILYGQNAFLFDLRKDFFEKHTIANHPLHKNNLYYMRRQVEGLSKEDLLGSEIVHKTPELTEEEREKLRSLGYIEYGE
jgi:arylsulfatase